MSDKNQQMTLAIGASQMSSFDNYYVSETNQLLIASLKRLVKDKQSDFVFISGLEGVGKSHLLEALSAYASELDQRFLYMPMQAFSQFPPEEILQSQQDFDIIAVDDVDACADNTQWQEALFDLYNQRYDSDKALIFTASTTAHNIAFTLKDLASRLSACLSFQMPLLNDDEQLALLAFLLKERGLELADNLAQFIVHRAPRDAKGLLEVINQIDNAQLVAGRKLTIPFIKEIFGW